MKNPMIVIGALACLLALPVAGCGAADHDTSSTTNATSAPAEGSFIARKVRQGIDHAKQELATRNIDLDSVHVGADDHSPDGNRAKAAISPQGTLIIDGKPVTASPAQTRLLLDYRQQLLTIAEAGMDIGARGADIGVAAAKEAMLGALAGKSDKDIEASLKPQTDQIEADARKLCTRMPALMAAQQALAAAMPAFKPYATMTQKDVDGCGKDIDKNGKKGSAVFSD